MHQARAWKASHDKKSKDLDVAEEKIKTLEEKLATTIKDLEDTRVDLVVVTDQKERWIDAYMETPEFKELMEDDDPLTHPISFKEGWDETKAILKAHLGIFEASAFPCPLVLQPSKAVIAEASRLLKEREFDDSEGSSSFEFEKSEATPQKKAPSPSSKSSSKEESEGVLLAGVQGRRRRALGRRRRALGRRCLFLGRQCPFLMKNLLERSRKL